VEESEDISENRRRKSTSSSIHSEPIITVTSRKKKRKTKGRENRTDNLTDDSSISKSTSKRNYDAAESEERKRLKSAMDKMQERHLAYAAKNAELKAKQLEQIKKLNAQLRAATAEASSQTSARKRSADQISVDTSNIVTDCTASASVTKIAQVIRQSSEREAAAAKLAMEAKVALAKTQGQLDTEKAKLELVEVLLKKEEQCREEALEFSRKIENEKVAKFEMMKTLLDVESKNYAEKLKIVEEKIETSKLLSIETTKTEMITMRLKAEAKDHEEKLKIVKEKNEISQLLAIETAKGDMMTWRLTAEEKNHAEQSNRDQVKFDTLLQREDSHRQETKENEERLFKERENVRNNQLDFAKLNAEVLIAAFQSVAK
jgi:hypothetical protein